MLGLAIGLAAGAVLTGCSGDSADDERDALADDLLEETGGALDQATARCVADGLQDEFGDDSFEQILEAASGDGSEEEAVRIQVIDIFAGCDALGPIIDDAP